MRTPAEIVAKIRQVRFEYLKSAYQAELSKRPANCRYNRTVTFYGEGDVVTRLCGYYSDDVNYVVCDTEECARACDAFVCKKDKKGVREQIEADMATNPQKYPELLVLTWALGGTRVSDKTLKSRIINIIKWVRGLWYEQAAATSFRKANGETGRSVPDRFGEQAGNNDGAATRALSAEREDYRV